MREEAVTDFLANEYLLHSGREESDEVDDA